MVTIDSLLNFIWEDAPFGDLTSDTIIPDIDCHATISIEMQATVAGLEEAAALFNYFGIQVDQSVKDGTAVDTGDILLKIHGNAKKILLVERAALNIVGRMSGIATMTAKFVKQVQSVNPKCRVAATRKTCPGLRELDKKAVVCGGGYPHRSSLSDGILIKNNHLALIGLEDAITKARSRYLHHSVEVEVGSAEDAVRAAQAGSDIIMFDNMSTEDVRESLDALKHRGLRDRVVIEISGGISSENILSYAATGVDVISIGALTHSVSNIPVHLHISPL
jgi:nicotinate-nucleotide pyrophosphorylase (carboxylating)